LSATEQLRPIIGHWITEGETVATPDVPAVRVVTSDIYTWLPPGNVVLHTAYGRAGDDPGGGLEVITPNLDGVGFLSYFFDGSGAFALSTLTIEGDTWFWQGETRRCRGEFSDGGRVLAAHHERLDGDTWFPAVEVVLTKSG
jgi:hypothetical protein